MNCISGLPDQFGQLKETIHVPVRLRFAGRLRTGEVLAEGHALFGHRPEVDHFLSGVFALQLLEKSFGSEGTIECRWRVANAVVFQKGRSRLGGH
ncbi:hypothetical protein D3C85_1133310 [compost metagenome]